MDLISVGTILFSTLLCGGGVILIQHLCSIKSRKREEARKEKELKLKEDALRLENERQRLNDLPNIQFGGTSFSSPLNREHHIEIANIGESCRITKIQHNPQWHLLNPHLPHSLNKGEHINLKFILPQNDPVLTKTFPEYII